MLTISQEEPYEKKLITCATPILTFIVVILVTFCVSNVSQQTLKEYSQSVVIINTSKESFLKDGLYVNYRNESMGYEVKGNYEEYNIIIKNQQQGVNLEYIYKNGALVNQKFHIVGWRMNIIIITNIFALLINILVFLKVVPYYFAEKEVNIRRMKKTKILFKPV